MLRKEEKTAVIEANKTHENDTGSPEVQIAILTAEINELNRHFETHIHDFHSKRGLMIKIGHRKSLLAYLKKNDLKAYESLIAKLGLRR